MTAHQARNWFRLAAGSLVALGCSAVDSDAVFSHVPPGGGASGAEGLGSSGGALPQAGSSLQAGAGADAFAGAGGGGAAPLSGGGASSLGGASGGGSGSAGVSVGAGGSAGAPAGGSTTVGGATGGSATGGLANTAGTAASAGTASGGTQAAGGEMSAPVAFAQVKTILDRSCSGTLGCHGVFGRRPMLQSSDSNLSETLATFAVSKCSGHKLIVPGSRATSALVEVVSGGCGSLRMPPSCSSSTCISTADLTTLTTWIDAGAPRQ
jgi:hypothetical protein